MQLEWYIYTGITYLLFFIILLFLLKKINNRRSSPGTFVRLYYHAQRYKLLHFPNITTLIAGSLGVLLIFSLCLYHGSFRLPFKQNYLPFLALIPRSFLTAAVIISIAGPSILALNYRLFKGDTINLNPSSDNFARIYQSNDRVFLDAQFDHTHQLNALIIVWGAFAYDIITTPIENLIKLGNAIQVNYEHTAKEYSSGDALNTIISLVQQDGISLVIVTLAFGFVVWASIRLISGELSTVEIVKLYIRPERMSFPPFASRITLYRFIFVLFSFLYSAWSNSYLLMQARELMTQGYKPDVIKKIDEATNATLNLPSRNSGIYVIIFVIVLFILCLVVAFYYAEFKDTLKTKLNQLKERQKNEDQLTNENDVGNLIPPSL